MFCVFLRCYYLYLNLRLAPMDLQLYVILNRRVYLERDYNCHHFGMVFQMGQ